jgi:hypothetical protein
MRSRGQVDYRDTYLLGREQVGTFDRQREQVDATAQRVSVVQEKWSMHHPADVQRVLQEVPRHKPVWRPTYAPGRNPIGKLWHWLRRDVLWAHRLADDGHTVHLQVNAFLDPFAHGSRALLRFVGLIGDGHLAYVLSSP